MRQARKDVNFNLAKMTLKQNIFHLLIFLALVSFGFFGSLSHIFTVALIIFTFFNFIQSRELKHIDRNAFLVFLNLTICFFLFLLHGIINNNFEATLRSLSTLLPVPLIGLLMVFHSNADFKLNSNQVSRFSQFSVLFALSIYLFLKINTDSNSYYYQFHSGRLNLFSGNPIPFSFVMLGLSFFCLVDWRNCNTKNKLIAFIVFTVGLYLGIFLSESRGTLLAFLVVYPILVFYLSDSILLTLFIIGVKVLTIFLFLKSANLENFFEYEPVSRIKEGINTLLFLTNSDYSIFQRLEIWSAATKAIFDAPIFGYGISERYNALIPYLGQSMQKYTHPHNDVMAGIIGIGFIGGIATLTSFMSSLFAALKSSFKSSEKLLFGLIITLYSITIGSVSTVLFNDISSAWLAFSAYIIWSTNFTYGNQNSKILS